MDDYCEEHGLQDAGGCRLCASHERIRDLELALNSACTAFAKLTNRSVFPTLGHVREFAEEQYRRAEDVRMMRGK